MAAYPVGFSVERPARFDRIQVAIRLLLLIVLGAVGLSLGALWWLIYLLLPVLAAVLVSQKGGARYLAEDGAWLSRAIGWVFAAYAYLLFVTDRFPIGPPAELVRIRLVPTGIPTPGGALLRLLTSLPSAVVLWLLGLLSGLAWLVMAVTVLVDRRVPTFLHDFQCAVVRWSARLVGYHASLVETYPPFALDLGPDELLERRQV
jgi:hypothetical protein